MADKHLTSISTKIFDTIYKKATDRDGLSHRDRLDIGNRFGRTKAQSSRISKALTVFDNLIISRSEHNKFARLLKLNTDARSQLWGIVGHDGMSLLRQQFINNPGVAHVKLLDAKASVQVRAAAAAHIGRSDDPAAKHLLTKALKAEHDPSVKLAIVRALIAVDSSVRKRLDVVAALVAVYRKGDASVRSFVLNWLKDVRSRPIVDIFINASTHRNPVIRSRSVRILAKLDDPKAKAAVLKALKDTDERVRAAVPRSLALEVTRVKGLLKLMKSPKTRPADRDYLIKKLSQVKEPVAQLVVAELAKLLKHRDTGMRFIAVTALKPLRGENVVDVFIPLLEDKNDKMRVLAVEYFAKVGSIRGLIAALKNKDGGVRFRAMEGLAKVKKPFPYAPLLTALKDPLDSIRQRAIRLLATYKNPPVISALIARLKTEPVRLIRMNIVRILAGTSDAKAIEALAIQMEKDPSYDVQDKIWGYLRSGLLNKFFDKWPVSKLLTALAHPAFAIRMYAAQRLGRDGDMSTISKLNARLQNEPNQNVKRSIDKALRSLAIKLFKRASVSKLLKALTHPAFAIKMYAAQRLGRDGDMSTISKLNARLQNEPNEDVKSSIDKDIKLLATKSLEFASVSKLLKALVHPVTTVRLFAARLLHKCHDTSGVPTLLARLTKEPVTDVRIEIVRTLASISTENATITAALIKATKDPSPKVRESAVWSLSHKTGSRVISALINSTKDPDRDVRYAAVGLLGEKKGPKIVTALIKALGDSSDEVQRIAVQSLSWQWHSRGSSQKDRRRVLSALIAGSKARKRSLRCNALWALLHMKNQKALRALAVALKHPDKKTRDYAERVFVRINTARYSWAVPSLIALFRSRSKTIRDHAGRALFRIGTARAIFAVLKASNIELRMAAVRQLGKNAYPNATSTLISLLEDPVLDVREVAIEALKNKRDPSVAPALTKALMHPKAAVRKAAVHILAERKDLESIIALTSAIQSDDAYVRKLARQSSRTSLKSLQTLLIVLMDPQDRMYGVVAGVIKKYKHHYKPLLGKVLRSGSYTWERGAATALEIVGDKEAMTELLSLLKKSPSGTYASKIAVRALVKSKDPRVIPTFLALLKKKGSNICPYILRALIRVKFPITHAAFHNKYEYSHGGFNDKGIAIRLVQGLDKPGNIRAITKYVEDHFSWKSTSYLWILKPLVEMNDVRAIPMLMKALKVASKSNWYRSKHREMLKKALKHFVRPKAIPYFATALKEGGKYNYANVTAITVLSAIGGPRVNQILIGALQPGCAYYERCDDMVKAAVEALGKTKDPRVEAALIAVMKKKGAFTYYSDEYPFIKALGELGSKKAVPLIIKRLKSPDYTMREVAVTALGKIKDKSAVTALVERMLNDKEGSVRGLAARALGEIGDPRALKVLLRVSDKDTDEWVRNEALKALHKLPPQLIRAS